MQLVNAVNMLNIGLLGKGTTANQKEKKKKDQESKEEKMF